MCESKCVCERECVCSILISLFYKQKPNTTFVHSENLNLPRLICSGLYNQQVVKQAESHMATFQPSASVLFCLGTVTGFLSEVWVQARVSGLNLQTPEEEILVVMVRMNQVHH